MEDNKEYKEFVEKFKRKKTTDDCYTPPAVYDVVLNYVREKCDIEGLRVLRPFHPEGDYQKETYDDNCVVIDNPPFSIISEIIRFYLDRGIKFFLFAPHLTLFSSNQDYTSIVTNSSIVYENSAVVKTGFVSNMFGDAKIIGDAELCQRLKDVQDEGKVCLPRYVYPDNIVTVTKIANIVSKGESVVIKKKDLAFCRGLESQKKMKKSMFGSGFISSNKTAEYLKEKETSARVLKEQRDAQKVLNEEKIVWELSATEQAIIKELDGGF